MQLTWSYSDWQWREPSDVVTEQQRVGYLIFNYEVYLWHLFCLSRVIWVVSISKVGTYVFGCLDWKDRITESEIVK